MAEKSVIRQLKWSRDFARRAIAVARSDQSAGHIKPVHAYDCPDPILRIAPVENKYPTFFVFKVLENGD